MLELLEERIVLSGSWTSLAASGTGPPNGGAAMMLLSDGSILIQNGSNPPPSASFYKLSPQANTGSYVNGVWSNAASMNEPRLFFTTVMMPNGKVFGVGGEYPKFSNTAEVYDPVANTWTLVDPAPTPSTNVFLNGKVTGASNSSPITITTSSAGQLQNGMQVTISGVNGNTAANGTFTAANVTSTKFDLVGSTGNGAYTNGGAWNSYAPQFGDDPTVVLPDGQILAGYFNGTTTYRVNLSAAPGSQWTTTTQGKLHNDQSDEESWVKLPDGSILSYDVFASAGGTFQGQRYVPSSDTWVDASTLSSTNPPSVLSSGSQGSELGPGFLQSDGKAIFFGANGNTAIYDPATDIWSAGPAEPQKNLTIASNGSVSNGGPATFLVGTDDPGAVLPNGNILISLSPLGSLNSSGSYNFPSATYIYEYDPIAQSFTEITPGGLSGVNAFQLNMVLLPTGQVLLSNEGNAFQVYTEDPATGPQSSWRPNVSKIVDGGGGTFTLTGTQLNGIDEGAAYGDDNESSSNYPIIQLKDSGGNVSYARTFNWSSTGVATGSTPVTTQFTLPAGHTLSDFTTLTVIANGIPSAPYAFHITPNVTPPGTQASVEGASHSFSLGSFVDPDGGPWKVDVNWGDGTPDTVFIATATGTIAAQNHTYVEEGSYTPTITVTDTAQGLFESKKFNVNVSDPSVVAQGVLVVAVDCRTVTVTTATFTDPGGPETLGDYSASIDWGDSTTASAGSISFAAGVFTVTGAHSYASHGNYTITTTIKHEESTPTVVTSAATITDDIGLLLLDPSGVGSLTVKGNGQVLVTGCGAVVVDSNSPYAAVVVDIGMVTASQIHVTGGLYTSGNAVVTPDVEHDAPIADPLGLGAPSPQAPFFDAVYNTSYDSIALSPGTYLGGIHVAGTASVSLAPGVYYMVGGGFSVIGNGSVDGNDVVIVNLPSGPWAPVQFGSNAQVNLTARASGPLKGIVIFQDPSMSIPIQIDGNARVNLTGVVYAPSADVQLGGNAVVTINPSPGTATLPPINGALIAYDLHVGGNGKLIINPDPVMPVAPMMFSLASVDVNDAAIDALDEVSLGLIGAFDAKKKT